MIIQKQLFILITLIGMGIIGKASAQNYELVWEDNFTGNTIDSSKWNIEEEIGVWNTGANSEFQHYRKENVNVGDDGNGNNCLILTAKKENYNGYAYTSGKVSTKGKFAFKKGKLEASIKIPDLTNGLWPAFWTLGYTSTGWPDCGEIDVLEMGHAKGIEDGVLNSYVGAHLFWGPYPRDYGTEYLANEDLSTGYFKHTVIWDDSEINVYFNDAASPYFSMGITADDTEEYRNFMHYIILNLAVGGSVPGIYDAAGITANFPAHMYVDWVKLYQEEGKEDFKSEDIALFGNYGIYEEQDGSHMALKNNYDLFTNTSGLSETNDESPYHGKEVLSYKTETGNYVLALNGGLKRNMSNYNQGAVQFQIKTNIKESIHIGIKDATGEEKLISYSDEAGQNFARDNSWQSVILPIAELANEITIDQILSLLIIKGESIGDASLCIDEVMYTEKIPVSGYYAVFADNSQITESFEVDNATYNMYIWNNTVSFNDDIPAYEGENVLSFTSSGAENWFGFGYHSSSPMNFSAYADGYLNISIKTLSKDAFYIGLDGENSTAQIDFPGNSDPYNLARDGEWHHIKIPFKDLAAQGLNLSSINHVFKTGGESIGAIAYDNIYFSVDDSEIENPAICYADKLTISPGNKSISTSETLTLKANVLNQFSKAYGEKVSWSSGGGTIDEDGKFSSTEAGEFVITASIEELSEEAQVSVSLASSIEQGLENSIQAYLNSNTASIHISGIEGTCILTVYNASGQKIMQKIENQAISNIDLSTQASGVYILSISNLESNVSYKFIK